MLIRLRIVALTMALGCTLGTAGCLQDGLGGRSNPWDAMPNLAKESRADKLDWARQPIDFGADPNTTDSATRTPLMIAAALGSSDLITALIKAGADFHRTDLSGNTPLMYAAAFGETGNVLTLVAAGADVLAVNRDKKSALHQASFSNQSNAQSVDALIELGSNIAALDYIRMSPLATAAGHAQDPARLKVLLDHNHDDHDPAATQDRLNNALVWAALGNDTQTIETLVVAGAAINSSDEIWGTALHAAAHSGDAATIDTLLRLGADLNSTDHPEGETPLIVAVDFGSAATTRALIDAGANLNEPDRRGLTPLMYATTTMIGGAHGPAQDFKDVYERMDLLIAAGARIEAADSTGRTALRLAMEGRSDSQRIDRLLSAGADANAADSDGVTVLMAAAGHCPTQTVKMLLEKGAAAEARDAHQRTTLMWAVTTGSWGSQETLPALINAGADIRAKDDNGMTALAHAAESLHCGAVASLMQLGADPKPLGWTNLHIACITLNEAGVYIAFKAGANPNACDVWGRTPLIWAARVIRGNMLFPPLLEAGATVDVADHDGRTALIHAARTAYIEEVKALLDAGADIHTADRAGMTPLMYAASRQAGRYIVELLLQRGAQVDARDALGRTALLCELDNPNGDIETVAMLFKSGASISITDHQGAGALDHARKSPNWFSRKQAVELIQNAASRTTD